jgi:hypothetical protein
MTSWTRRVAAAATCSMFLAACGGGASSTAPHMSQTINSSTGPKGSVTLSVAFPANFHHAMTHAHTIATPASLVKKLTPASSSRRQPQYINPTSGNVLHVYTQASFNSGLVEVTPSGGEAVLSGQTLDNSQSFTIAVPAGTYYGVTVEENDSNGNLLAEGVNDNDPALSIAPGSSGNTLSIALFMNPAYIVATTDPVNGGDATVLTTDGSTEFCAFHKPQTVFLLPADSNAGYVTPGTPAGAQSDQYGTPTIPTVGLYSWSASPSDGSAIAGGSLPSSVLTTFETNPTSTTLYASFSAYQSNQQPYSTAYGYAAFGGAGSVTCTPSANFTPSSLTGSGQTAALQIEGGTAPYTITETDGNCTFAQADAPLTDEWTFTSTISYGSCTPTITDTNGTTTQPSLTVAGP